MKTINIIKKTAIIGLALFGIFQSSQAQSIQLKATYYGDKFVNKGDTVELVLVDGRGDFQWQHSYDQVNWENIDGANATSISSRIDSTVWFRVKMEEENCDPAFSEIGSVVPMMISEDAVVLDSESLEIHSDSVELSQGIYRMSTSQDIDPQPGEVLVGQNDKGFIRKVESVTKNGDEWVVTTTQGTLEDVIDEISLSDSLIIDINGGGMKTANVSGQEVPVKLTYTAPGLTLKSGAEGISLGSMILVDEDTGDGHIYAAIESGLIIFNPVFRRRLDVRMNKGLEYFLFSVSGEMDITADISLESSGATNPQIGAINLFTAEIGPVMIGPVATYINIDFVLNSEIVTGGTGTFSVGYKSSFITDYGASYYDLDNPKWTAIWEKSNESAVTPPEFELESTASLNIEVNPVLNMKIAGIQTAYLSLNNYLKGAASSGAEGWTTSAHAGTSSSVAYDVDVIGYDIIPAQFENSAEDWLIYEASGIEGTPVVSTFPAEKVEKDSYILKGRIDDNKGTGIIRRGFCWGNEPSPGFDDNSIELSSTSYDLSYLLEGLPLDKTWYFRAFAENAAGVGWGGDQEFSTAVDLPSVQTTPPYNIMALSAWAGGVVLDDGGAEVTERGICWDTSGDPDLGNHVIQAGSGTGSFECVMDALYCANYESYYVRAYATNSAGTAYGELKDFGTKDNDGIFTDPRDGNGYYWIRYGEQDWMINNLGYMPSVSPASNGSEEESRYYIYDYNGDIVQDAKNNENWDLYKTLYNWTAAMDACPAGWHLPHLGEYSDLFNYLIGKGVYGYGGNSGTIGKALASKTGWVGDFNTAGTIGNDLENNNTSGFDARPGGFRYPGSNYYDPPDFRNEGNTAYFWTSLNPRFSRPSTISIDLHGASNSPATSDHFELLVTWGYDLGFSVRCLRGVIDPIVKTRSVSDIQKTSARCDGFILTSGGHDIISRGICWVEGTNIPSINDNKVISDDESREFSADLTGLSMGVSYNCRAFVETSSGVYYGSHTSFSTETNGADGYFTDSRDGKQYGYKIIGSQTWMMENLAYLPDVSPSSAGSNADPFYYVTGYDGSSVSSAKANDNFSTYGVLYNWPAAKTACPGGWHMPRDEEWKTLEKYLGMSSADADGTGWRESGEVGKKLKSTDGWTESGTPGDNSSGFYALPAGYRESSGSFRRLHDDADFWSPLESSNSMVYYRSLDFNGNGVRRGDINGSAGFSIRCLQGEEQRTLPTVSTDPVTNIAENSADCGGNVSDDGWATVTARGVCWNTSGNPTISNNKTVDGSGIGSYSSSITGLSENTTYYVRAYAINSVGTAYGNQREFKTESSGGGADGSFTDSRDGKSYDYKNYGSQTWMIENLAYLPSVSPSSAGTLEDAYYYVYGYEGSDVSSAKQADNYAKSGVLYNYEAAKTACPSGWHVPTHEEWTEFENYLISNGFGYGGSGDDIGKSLASATGWIEDATSGNVGNDQSSNNASSFNAPPGGYRSGGGGVGGLDFNATFWTSSPYESTRLWTRYLYYNADVLFRNNYGAQNGFSIRCIEGSKPNTIPMVYTDEVTGVTENSAETGGVVSDDGGASVTARGVCWNTSGNPTIGDNKTVDGSGLGTFSSSITGLSANTTYYVRAYATNSVGTAYGFQKEFTTESGGDGEVGTFTDSRDGKVYGYKQYGSQTWMTENLAYLPEVYSSNGGSEASRYYYVYDYEGEDVSAAKAEANYSKYGALYNWDAAIYECPEGWHLPSSSDFQDLLNYLTENGYGFEGSGDDVAKAMSSTSGWVSTDNPGEVGNNQEGNNSSGFNALPTGYRYSQGEFLYQGDRTFFWASDTDGSSGGVLIIKNWHTTPVIGTANRAYGFPIRCLKD